MWTKFRVLWKPSYPRRYIKWLRNCKHDTDHHIVVVQQGSVDGKPYGRPEVWCECPRCGKRL